MWKFIRTCIVVVLTIGLPIFIYLAFIADEPVMAPDNDVELGNRVVESIAADPEEYPLLDEQQYPQIYAHLRTMLNKVLSSPDIRYRDTFQYQQVKIINRDDVLNAFCTPGGFIYVYSGLIKYLDAEDHLAGVIGHEIAHAELRHSALDMQREYGLDRLMEYLIFATPATLGTLIQVEMLEKLTSLKYSRKQEAAADDWSVRYLDDTDYACNGTSGFFQKLLDKGQDAGVPEFLSDHPVSVNRVRDVNQRATDLGCDTQLKDQSAWRAFQQSFPPPAPPPVKDKDKNQDEQQSLTAHQTSGKLEADRIAHASGVD